MWSLIGTMVVLGLSANEPTALLVVLVVLRSGRGRGAAFVTGWMTALIVVTVGAGFALRHGLGPRRGGPHRVTLVIELLIGVALVVWARSRWGTRQAWLLGVPVLLGVLWAATGDVMLVLPNLI